MAEYHSVVAGLPKLFTIGATIGLPSIDPLHNVPRSRFQYSLACKSTGNTAHG
jgi:hypothetical protein